MTEETFLSKIERTVALLNALGTSMADIKAEINSDHAEWEGKLTPIQEAVTKLEAALGATTEGGKTLVEQLADLAEKDEEFAGLIEGLSGDIGDLNEKFGSYLTEERFNTLVAGADEAYDTLKEIGDALKEDNTAIEAINAVIGTTGTKIDDLVAKHVTYDDDIAGLKTKDTEIEGKIEGLLTKEEGEALEKNVTDAVDELEEFVGCTLDVVNQRLSEILGTDAEGNAN